MNPSPKTRDMIYLILALTDAVVLVYSIITRTYSPELLVALVGFNGLGQALAKANVSDV